MMPQMGDHSFEQTMQESYDYGQGSTTHPQESQMIPGAPNKSRLNLWKSHQDGGENRVQGGAQGANMKTGKTFISFQPNGVFSCQHLLSILFVQALALMTPLGQLQVIAEANGLIQLSHRQQTLGILVWSEIRSLLLWMASVYRSLSLASCGRVLG
jgi:hypothetical protein